MVEKEQQGDDESLNLLKLLKKNPEDYLEVEYDPNDKHSIQYLYYSSQKMRDNYAKHSDIIFINKRFTQNRFKKPLVLLFAVGNTGKSLLIGMALIEKEETYYFSKMTQSFLKTMNFITPQTIIIERQLKLYSSLKENMSQSNILFCFYHIQRTFKQQYAFLEKERPDDFQKIIELPIIENEQAFEQQLREIMQIVFANEYHKLIMQKLGAEKRFWPKWAHLRFYTAGISVCQRNEQIKQFLKPALKKRESAVSEALKRVLNVDGKEFKLSHEYQKVSQKHEQVFKVAHFLNHVVKDQCTQYAF